MWERKYLDRNRGLQHTSFEKALKRAGINYIKNDHINAAPTKEFKFGDHVHNESNPLGLHSHGEDKVLGGGHTHSPNNLLGVHHHRKDNPQMVQADGKHVHYSIDPEDNNGDGKTSDGWHKHSEENLG